MADELHIPELNPVIFFDVDRENLPAHQTRHFDKWMFDERLYFWQQKEDYKQVWQTTDIINLQFESKVDPVIVKVLDDWGQEITPFPALVKLPNKFIPNTYAMEVSIALAGLPTGCYRLQITAGIGAQKKIMISNCQYVSADPLPGTILLQYWNSKYHKDVIFETGIKFQLRVLGVLGFLNKVRSDEAYRDQKYTQTILNSKSTKQWPIYFGIPADGILSRPDYIGLPDDIINIIDEAWSCNNVMVDGKLFTIADGTKIEYPEIDSNGLYPKRGMKVMVEPGINRNSRVFSVDTDPEKKLITTIIVQAKVFGDTGNQGSSNTVPVVNVIQE